MSRKLLFGVGKKDFKIDFYRASGKGGQKRNKTDSACRITHLESKAVGNCSDYRSQIKNKTEAFKRLTDTKIFKNWMKLEIARTTQKDKELENAVNKWVDEQMAAGN